MSIKKRNEYFANFSKQETTYIKNKEGLQDINEGGGTECAPSEFQIISLPNFRTFN